MAFRTSSITYPTEYNDPVWGPAIIATVPSGIQPGDFILQLVIVDRNSAPTFNIEVIGEGSNPLVDIRFLFFQWN